MFGKTICTLGLLVLLVPFLPNAHRQAVAQESPTNQENSGAPKRPKPVDPNDPRLTFSFPIHPGGKPLRFKVNLDRAGSAAEVSVFKEGVSTPIQTLKACGRVGLTDPITEGWGGYYISNLLEHSDLNFDGFEDLELLDYAIPHLDKKIYCTYLWDSKTGRFLYSKELTDISVNLEVHPENKTLISEDSWEGGLWHDSTYRWNGDKLELIEESSLLGDANKQKDSKCGFTFSCSRLFKGKMVITFEMSVCAPMDELPDCPAAAPSSVSMVRQGKPKTKTKK